ncbi:hypothetical protein B0H15DRAFT_973779 [Mycena belliarum]|uniref:Uncharacterized protein n=1 Tax=Mycena belliarum TaxID=1033014 RepID=A0AAD6TKN7_9AGAR|nr:hypothetical protein B0H15DRAFT_973779 [Mycena belliae]
MHSVLLGLLGLGLCPTALSLPQSYAASRQFDGLGDTGSPTDVSDDGVSNVAAPAPAAPLPLLPVLLASLSALLLLLLLLALTLTLYLRRRRRHRAQKQSEPAFRRARMVRSLPAPVFAVPRDVESDGEDDMREMREVAPYPFAHGAGA